MPTETTTPDGLAEMKCRHCGDSNWPGHCPYLDGQCVCAALDCSYCNGTGLRYFGLSVECPKGTDTWDWECVCHGTGRIPDVTVEKLLDIVRNLPFAHKCEVHGRIFYMLTPKPEYPMTALSRWLDLTDDERKDALAAAIGRADEL